MSKAELEVVRDSGYEVTQAIRKSVADELLGYVLSVRRQNTSEWMDGLVEEINRYAEATGETDRVAIHRDGLRIIRGESA